MAEGALTEAQARELIEAYGYLTAAQVAAQITQRLADGGYLTSAEIADLVNTTINERGFITLAQATTIAEQEADRVKQELTVTINALITRIETLENSADTQDGRLTTLENTQADHEGRIATLEGSQGDQDDRLDDLEDTQTTHGGRITDLETEQADLDVRITSLETTGSGSVDYILGPSTREDNGWFEHGGEQGVRAAGAACRDTYSSEPTAHYCSLAEVQSALSIGAHGDNLDEVETWMFPTYTKSDQGFLGDADFCQSLLYHSGHAATGVSFKIDMNASSDSGATGVRIQYNEFKSCNDELPVLCCR